MSDLQVAKAFVQKNHAPLKPMQAFQTFNLIQANLKSDKTIPGRGYLSFSRLVLFFSGPSPTPDLETAITLVAAALSPALCTGVSRSVAAVLLSSCNPTVTEASSQQRIIYTTNDSLGRRRGDAAVVLRPPLVLVVPLYVLRDSVQLLIKLCDAFLHWLHCLGHCEL